MILLCRPHFPKHCITSYVSANLLKSNVAFGSAKEPVADGGTGNDLDVHCRKFNRSAFHVLPLCLTSVCCFHFCSSTAFHLSGCISQTRGTTFPVGSKPTPPSNASPVEGGGVGGSLPAGGSQAGAGPAIMDKYEALRFKAEQARRQQSVPPSSLPSEDDDREDSPRLGQAGGADGK